MLSVRQRCELGTIAAMRSERLGLLTFLDALHFLTALWASVHSTYSGSARIRRLGWTCRQRCALQWPAPNLRRGISTWLAEFHVPPIELQREFARRVRAVEKLKTAQRASLAELDALFASLQHRAFRGELCERVVGI